MCRKIGCNRNVKNRFNKTEFVRIVLNLSLTTSYRYIFDTNQMVSDVFIRFWVGNECAQKEIAADLSGCIENLIGQRSSDRCSWR